MHFLVIVSAILSISAAKQNYLNNDFNLEFKGKLGKLIYNLGKLKNLCSFLTLLIDPVLLNYMVYDFITENFFIN